MTLARVVGTVVSERRADSITKLVYLLVERCNQHGAGKQDFLVAIDMMGAKQGEVVLLSTGSSARQTELTDDKPIDAVIIGIIETIDERGIVTYQKGEEKP